LARSADHHGGYGADVICMAVEWISSAGQPAPDPAAPEALLAVIADLQAQQVAGVEVLAAARQRSEMDAATILALTEQRDQLSAQAAALQRQTAELWRHVDSLRGQLAAVQQQAQPETAPETAADAAADTAPDAASQPALAAEPEPQPDLEPQAVDPTPSPASPAPDRVSIFVARAEVAGEADVEPAASEPAYGLDSGAASAVVDILPEQPTKRTRLSRLRG
jgi:CheY-like chemotaxis protein